MPTCKKCDQAIPNRTAHVKGCGAVVTKPVEAKTPPASDKLDQVVQMLGSVIQKQNTIEKRLDKIEEPTFSPMPPSPRANTIQSLETNLAIAKETQVKEGSPDDPKCVFGIHYPSDFGQKRINGGGDGPFTPPTKRCFPAPPALKKIVDEILTSEFNADVLPDPFSSTFMFSIIVPQKYCIAEDYRTGRVKDLRVKVISNYGAEPEVRAWCEKVKNKIYKEHMGAQLPSPFTVPSMRSGTLVGDVVGPMTPQSIENYSAKLVS